MSLTIKPSESLSKNPKIKKMQIKYWNILLFGKEDYFSKNPEIKKMQIELLKTMQMM